MLEEVKFNSLSEEVWIDVVRMLLSVSFGYIFWRSVLNSYDAFYD